jgi:hypothetical protein
VVFSFDFKTFWLDYVVFWAGAGGFTVGIIGAAMAVLLRAFGFRHVREASDVVGWAPAMEVGEPPSVIVWFGAWAFVGSVAGGTMGVVLWFNPAG